jgi:hypothetical protein
MYAGTAFLVARLHPVLPICRPDGTGFKLRRSDMSVDYNNTPPLFFKPCQGDMTVAPGDNPAEHIKTYFLGILCHGIAPRATDMPLLRS